MDVSTENTTTLHSPSFNPQFASMKYANLIGSTLVMVFGIMTNGVVIVFSTIHRRVLLTPCTVFMFSLTIGCLLYSLFQPLGLLRILEHTWPFGDIGCKLYTLNIEVYKLVVPFTLTLLAVLSHRNSIYGGLTFKGSSFLVSITWIAAILSTLPNVLNAHETINSEFNISHCNVNWPKPSHLSVVDQGKFLYVFILAYGIPCISLIASGCSILCRKNSENRTMRSRNIHDTNIYAQNTNAWVPLLQVIHLLCWLPYWIVQFCLHIGSFEMAKWFLCIHLFANLLADANCVITPVVYIMRCTKETVACPARRFPQERQLTEYHFAE